MKQVWGFMLIAAVSFASCKEENATKIGRVIGYKPIYSTDTDLYIIQNKPARNVVAAGKIYVKGDYIFQNEIGEGVHIINNSNPSNARRIGFIKIKGSQEISIKDHFLYSNNFRDLVVIDIANIDNAVEVKRIKNAFSVNNGTETPPQHGYFECVDKSKGVVTGWIQDSIYNPTCQN